MLLNRDVWLSHPSWFIVRGSVKDDSTTIGGTVQGRITAKDFAHQTDPPRLQRARRSRWHGGVLLSGDASQIELRVPALTSGDPSLVAFYQAGLGDLHTDRAISTWTRPSLLQKYPDLSSHPTTKSWKKNSSFNRIERQAGKRINFADLFRSGAETIQHSVFADTGVLFPLSIFEAVVSSRPTTRPGLWAWQESLIAQARDTGRILVPLTGQHRSFEGGTKYDVSEIINFPVQTIAGNITIRLQSYFFQHRTPSILLFLNTYDSLSFDCRTPKDAHLLRTELFPAALDWLQTKDYWHHMQQLHGRTIPLEFEFKELP